MFEGINLATLTAPGIVSLAVVLLLFGWLKPRRDFTDMRKDKDAQIDDWKRTAQTSEEARLLQTKQVDELLELTRTMHQMISALPKVEP